MKDYLKILIQEEARRLFKEAGEQPAMSGPSGTSAPAPTGEEPDAGGDDMGGLEDLFAGTDMDAMGGSDAPAGDMGDAAPADPNAAPETPSEPAPPPEPPKTPEEEIVDIAKGVSEKTKELPEILKAVKGAIQDKYGSPTEAIPVVQALLNSDNPTLKALAPRLNQFLNTKPQS